MSVKQGYKKHRKKAKESGMKEIRNLVGNNCFVRETEYSKLKQDMKDKALPILIMFMVLKRNGLLKTRGIVWKCAATVYKQR